jgi:hypothetical protein
MRRLDLRLSIALAFLAPLPAFSQTPVAPIDLPKVIFCSGQCYAVDEKGVRSTVTKGAVLREGQRLETGPGAYAQLKVGQGAELAVSERGRVAFDQKSVGGRDLVILDQGRIRMVAGEALGKIEKRNLELRTADGTFNVKGADIEAKKVGSAVAGSNLTYMKVNNGEASLRTGQVPVALSKDAVQGITGGKLITDRTFSLNEVALPPTQGGKPGIGPGSKLTITPSPVAGLPDRTVTLPTLTPVPTAMPPVMTTMTATTGTCLSCTTYTLSPTVSSISPTTTTSLTTTTSTTSTSTSLINSTLTTASTCLSCTSLTTTSPTTTTTTTTLSTTTSTTFKLNSTTLLLR